MTKWVKVTPDTLPPLGERVLTLDKWGHIKDRVLRHIRGAGEFFTPDGMKPGTDITHWMEMPDMPSARK